MISFSGGTEDNIRNDLLCSLIRNPLFDLRLSRKLSRGSSMRETIDITLPDAVEYAAELGKPFCGDGCHTHHVLL